MNRQSEIVAGEDRGVTAVIGFILIFGVLVITFSAYQAYVVPQQNSETEFDHYQDVQEQMIELRSNVVLMQESTSTRSAAVDLGVQYTSRAVFVNPGPASGNLHTDGTENENVNITIRNAEAVRSEGETDDFWNGTERVYNTGAIELEPDYNRFRAPPIVYEHSVAYNQIEDSDRSVPITGQSIVDGNRINIIALNGTLEEGGVGTKSVDLQPISTRSQTVEVSDTGDPITLEFASRMNASTWREVFEDQRVTNGGHVQGVSYLRDGPGEFVILELTMATGQRYQLELAKVGLGSGATDTETTYLTDVEGANAVVESGSTQRLTVEARDRFNVPQSGVQVEADAEGGTLSGDGTNRTGADGQATFVYEANTSGTHPINVTVESGYAPNSNHEPSTATNLTVEVVVQENNGSGSGGGNGGYDVNWQSPSGSAVSESPTSDRYQYNASQTGPLELTMSTDPAVEGAPVNYVITNRSRATLSKYSGGTDADGKDTTRLQPKTTGNVTVYVYSGSDSDKLRFNITNTGGTLSNSRTVVYEDAKDGRVKALKGDGGETQVIGPDQVDVLGPPGTDLDSDGAAELPYVDNGDLKIVDMDGKTETLVDTGNSADPATSKTLMTTGTWKGSDPSVFYAGSGGSRLYRVDASGSPEAVASPSDGVGAVMDTGDIDGDGETELVFADASQQVRYLNQDGSIDKLQNAGAGSNNGLGVGQLVELDGKVWALIVDGSRSIALVTDDGGNNKTIISTPSGNDKSLKAPITAADVDEDGESELVYPRTSKKIRYIDNPLGSGTQQEPLTSANADELQLTGKLGVVSG